MSRNAHFAQGANEVTILGATGRVPTRGTPQTSRLYGAEQFWREHSDNASLTTDDPSAFVEQIIHHSSMDTVPNISYLRNNWRSSDVIVAHPEEITEEFGKRVGGATQSNGLMFLPHNANFGVISHETAHLVGVHGQQFSGLVSRAEEGQGYGHEWPFARTHLTVVHHNLHPDDAKTLRMYYRAMGVQWRPRNPGHKGFG